MGTMSRQQRRARQRLLAKADNIEMAIANLDKNADEFGKKAYDKWVSETEPQIMQKAITKSFIWFLTFLRNKHGYGKVRMERFMRDFMEFCNDMEFYEVSAADMLDTLDDELGIDSRAMIETLRRRADQSMYDRRLKAMERERA